MVYIVQTKFSIGIYLSKAAIAYNRYLKKAKIISKENYLEALEYVIKESDGQITREEFVVNRLFQIRTRKIYIAIYDWNNIGFVKEDDLSQFMEQNNLNLGNVYFRRDLEYLQAQSFVQNLGAITAKGKVFLTNPPIEGVWYRRRC